MPHAGHLWQVNVFNGDNSGLTLAGNELVRQDEAVMPPVGGEAALDPRYHNPMLVTSSMVTARRA